MLNTVYRLVAPRTIQEELTDIQPSDDIVIVHPTHLSICNADQRYYQGKRSKEVLKKKLPMALIHEGIGNVVYDSTGEYKRGDLVVMVPNTPYEKDDIIAENYLRSSRFRSSGFDGLMQDSVAMRRDRIVRLPENINKDVAAFTEFSSVAYHTIDRFLQKSHNRRERIGIWGDGNLAFVTSLLLKQRLPETEVYVFGVYEDKMADFTFADGTYSIDDIPADMKFDHAFECVGNQASGDAINQIIDYINPEGTIGIMGVAEYPVPINTRMVLEKGLTIFGSSRSSAADFQNLVDFYVSHPKVVNYLELLVGEVVDVKSIEDMDRAFEADMHKAKGKTILHWNV